MKSSKWCVSPVEKVIGICTFLLTFVGVDPSNILSGIGFGRYENINLFLIANALSTKLWDNPESRSARNGQSGLQVEVEVRERKNELGDNEVCKDMGSVLLFWGQPIWSTGHDGLPICLTGWILWVLMFPQRMAFLQVFQRVGWLPMPLSLLGILRLCDCSSCKMHIGCYCGITITPHLLPFPWHWGVAHWGGLMVGHSEVVQLWCSGGGCCCLTHLHSSWCSQYRLSWCIVTCTSSQRVSGFLRSAIQSFSHSGRPS